GLLDTALHRAVERIPDAQIHRGPDDEGVWRSGPDEQTGAILGHRRLSIIDLSELGHQPMVDAATGCALSFNGEIFNFVALRQELQAQGVEFTSRTDTEVVLRAYIAWGAGFIERLHGMFAIALWDPSKAQVLLIRDRLGLKPIYITQIDQDGRYPSVLFASEVRGLLASGLVKRTLDPVGVSSYLWNGFVVGPNTILRGVSLLPAGSITRVSTEGKILGTESYWSLPTSTEPQSSSTEALRESITDAVRLRMVADVPIGVFLSGGVDSSAVAAIAAREVGGSGVRTFNVSFQEAEFDESSHAAHVAAKLGTEHHELHLTEAVFKDGLDDALGSLDQPTFDAVNTYFVSRLVREAGMTVAIAGTGGDEVFGGYRSFTALPRAQRFARMARHLPPSFVRTATRSAARVMSGAPGEVPPQTRWGKLDDVAATVGDMLSVYQVSYGMFTQRFLGELQVTSDPTDFGIPTERAAELRLAVSTSASIEAVALLETSLFLGERLLRDTDCASMATSLEVRLPLVDHSVLEAAAGTAYAARFEPLGQKKVLRDLAAPQIDPRQFDRPKAGFELPLGLWCRGALRDQMEAMFADDELAERVGLRGHVVRRLWRAFLNDAPGLYWSRLWSIYVLLRWTKQHHACL
ncbi:MAG: asparagine synthase (glutamine-hydrolyzing), partial [Planctomycetota bacterium]